MSMFSVLVSDDGVILLFKPMLGNSVCVHCEWIRRMSIFCRSFVLTELKLTISGIIGETRIDRTKMYMYIYLCIKLLCYIYFLCRVKSPCQWADLKKPKMKKFTGLRILRYFFYMYYLVNEKYNSGGTFCCILLSRKSKLYFIIFYWVGYFYHISKTNTRQSCLH